MADRSEAVAEDKEEGKAVFVVRDVAERRVLAVADTEGCPVAEDAVSGLIGLARIGVPSHFERSAEISCEAVSLPRWSSFHGFGCG